MVPGCYCFGVVAEPRSVKAMVPDWLGSVWWLASAVLAKVPGCHGSGVEAVADCSGCSAVVCE